MAVVWQNKNVLFWTEYAVYVKLNKEFSSWILEKKTKQNKGISASYICYLPRKKSTIILLFRLSGLVLFAVMWAQPQNARPVGFTHNPGTTRKQHTRHNSPEILDTMKS